MPTMWSVRLVPLLIAFTSLTPAVACAQANRGTEYRSLNTDVYHIAIQKNGEIDVMLGGVTPSIFDAFPMVWFEGEREPEPIPTDGRWTLRNRVEDRIGDGQGMVQQFKALEWSLRAYPTRPFFAVQVAYLNDGRKPVTVRAIFPWCVGEPGTGGVTLGDGTDAAVILTGAMRGEPALQIGAASSPDVIAVWNRVTGRSFIAGFATQGRGASSIEIGEPKGGDEAGFYRFRAMTEFEPPVVLQPGEKVTSEVMYIAIGEGDPIVGLQRYARAAAIANQIEKSPPPFVAWVATNPDPSTFAAMLDRAKTLASTDDVPFVLLGDVSTAPRPLTNEAIGSFAAAAEAANAAGFRAAVWCDPFTARDPVNGAVTSAEAIGRRLSEAGIRVVAGFDVNPDARSTIAVTEQIRALRRGLGDGAQVYATSPSLLAAILTDGVVTPGGTAARAVRSSSIAAPTIYMVDGTNWRQAATATLTDVALLLDLNGVLDWPDAPARLSALFPATKSRAVPADLFVSQRARVLHSRHENLLGIAHTVAVFNWGADSQTTALPLDRLGGTPGNYFSVYDYWAGKYLGTAIDRLNVDVAPSDVTLLVLRPVVSQPMPLVIGTNVGQSSPDFDAFEWDARNGRLRVATRSSHAYLLPILVPDEMQLADIEVTQGSGNISTREADGRVATLNVTPNGDAVADYTIVFERK